MLFANPGEYEPCGLFTIDHFKLIIITIIGIVIALKKTVNKSKEEIKQIIKRCTIVIWILEAIKIAFKIKTGGIRNINNYVPLYYCSLLLYAGALASYAKGKLQRTGEVFLATGGIAGGLIFILMPTTSLLTYPMFHIVSLYSFLFHGIMLYLGILINVTNYITLNLTDIKYYASLVGIVCVLAYILNNIFDSNLMFISKNFPGTPIESLYKFTGRFFTPVASICQMTLPFYTIYGMKKWDRVFFGLGKKRPGPKLQEEIMDKLILIDGNSIMNRAFYGIMGSKMLTTKDGKYTNAVYGFLAILFKILEDIQPQYIAVAFDLKGPTARHEMYEGYKANRHGMPEELAEQMPIIKDVLRAMNIDIIEKQGYEGDDILGTLAKFGEKQSLEVTILSGDRDTFQLASDHITIRIPRTKAGKTETEDYNRAKVIEEYGLEPEQLIEVKALQGDTSDNIPGVPGIGPKTAISLIQKYGTVENLYQKIEAGEDDLKGKQKENIVNNKEMAELSRKLGEIDTHVPLEDTLEDIKLEEWDKPKVLEIFEELRFNRFIERFKLRDIRGRFCFVPKCRRTRYRKGYTP